MNEWNHFALLRHAYNYAQQDTINTYKPGPDREKLEKQLSQSNPLTISLQQTSRRRQKKPYKILKKSQ